MDPEIDKIKTAEAGKRVPCFCGFFVGRLRLQINPPAFPVALDDGFNDADGFTGFFGGHGRPGAGADGFGQLLIIHFIAAGKRRNGRRNFQSVLFVNRF